MGVDDDIDLSAATAVIGIAGSELGRGLSLAHWLRARGYGACVVIDAGSGPLAVIVRAKESVDFNGQAAAYSLAYELACHRPDVEVEVRLERLG